MKVEMVDVDKLELDLENPRIARIIAMYEEDKINSETIALALGAADTQEGDTYASYRNLKESIRTNKGLIHPVIVNKQKDGKMVVIEGNTRLQIYREFNEDDVGGDWSRIPAVVHDDMDNVNKNATRLQAHLVGPRPWDPYSKAKYLYTLSTADFMTIDLIVEYCGGRRKQVLDYIQAYKDMEKHYRPALDNEEDFDPTRFSVLVELQRNSIKTALTEHGYDKDDFAKWVVDGLFMPLETVRALPNILSDTAAKKVFLEEGAKEARLVLSSRSKSKDVSLEGFSTLDLAYETIRRLIDIKHVEWQKMKADPSSEKRRALEELQYHLNETLEGFAGKEEEDA